MKHYCFEMITELMSIIWDLAFDKVSKHKNNSIKTPFDDV